VLDPVTMSVDLRPFKVSVFVVSLSGATLFACDETDEPNSKADSVDADTPSPDPPSKDPSSGPMPTGAMTPGGNPSAPIDASAEPETNPTVPVGSVLPQPTLPVDATGPLPTQSLTTPQGTAGTPVVPSGGAGNGGHPAVVGAGGMGAGSAGVGGGPTMMPAGFPCPASPGTPNLSATPQLVAGVPIVDMSDTVVEVDGGRPPLLIIEGPVWTGDAIYFSQLTTDTEPNPSRIFRIAAGGTPELWLDAAGSNGLALSGDGGLLAARHSDGSLTRIDLTTKAETILVNNYEGATFNSPNDIAVRSDGNLYFTDPDWQRPPERTAVPTRVYRVDPSGAISVVDETLRNPNGATLSIDETWLYVSGEMPLTRYPLMADGSTGAGETLGATAETLREADGMSMDCAGNLYVTAGQTVSVVNTNSPTFDIIGTFTFPDVQSVTNVAFGGPNGSTLYVTSLDIAPQLYTLEVGIVGRPY
jgi:gluconolactonase